MADAFSDIGASSLQPLFITGCCTTSICVGISVTSGWLLRKSECYNSLPSGYRERVWVTDILRFGLIVTLVSVGSITLTLLSIFDILRFRTAHWVLFGCFL
jgi:hypothetical protein